MATEAAWLNGEKERNTHVKSKTLLTGIGLLMEGLEWFVGSLFAIIFEWPTIIVQKSGGIEKLSVSVTLCG